MKENEAIEQLQDVYKRQPSHRAIRKNLFRMVGAP